MLSRLLELICGGYAHGNANSLDRLLAEVSEQAQKEPLAAFGRLQECYNKSLTDMDVRHLGAFTANLGGSGLGRFDDAITFIETLLDHPALEEGGDTEHSLWRAIACLQRCAKREVPAAEAMAKGARNANETARVEALSAQMLAARGRAPEAMPMLEAALGLIPDCDDEETWCKLRKSPTASQPSPNKISKSHKSF